MKNNDILTMCLRNLFKRKLRTILTMLGVVIGTVAIVVTVSLGLAVDLRFAQMIDGMGDVNTITVHNPANRWRTPEDEDDMNIPDLNAEVVAFFESISGVQSVLPVVEGQQLFFRSGIYVIDWVRVLGVRPHALAELGYAVAEGRLMHPGNSTEIVMGNRVPLYFRNPFAAWDEERWMNIWMGGEVEPFVDIFEDRISMSYDWNFIFGHEQLDQDFGFNDLDAPRPVRPISIDVVGLLEHTGDWNIDEVIFMDIELIQRLNRSAEQSQQQNQMDWLAMDVDEGWMWGGGHINARTNVQQEVSYAFVYVRAENLDYVAEIAEQITDIGMPAQYATQHIARWQEMAATQQQMLGAIGAVSLFVAAIGIANTMVMSTYERTREIGVMKVIGAALADIKKMFLIEAAMIGFFGGLLGVLLSYLVSFLMNNYFHVAFMGGMMDDMMAGGMMMEETEAAIVSLITPWLSGLALVFASLIGLISGYYPARRATKLSALNAIRTE